jgi:alpha-galactosidase
MKVERRAIARLAGCALRAGLIVTSAVFLLSHGRGRAAQAGRSPVKVFILAGQSNMQGKGRVSHLDDLTKDPAKKATFGHLKTPDGQWVVRRDVWIDYLGRKGGLSVGYGGGRNQIGPEMQIGHVLGDHLDNQVLLIKCAWGGRSLKVRFRPPSSGGEVGPDYKTMVAHVHTVLGNLKQHFPDYDGRGYEIVGFLWFQGWNDMIDGEAVAQYEENFANLVRDLRKEFSVPEMPFVIAETGNCGNMKFRKAQAATAERPEFKGQGAFVPTSSFKRSTPSFDGGYHWNGNAESYFLIGTAMGKAMAKLVPTLNTKELTSRTRPIFAMINAMRYAAAHAAIRKLEEKLESESANPDADKDKLAREKDLVGRMKPMVMKRVDAVVEEIKQLDSIGDVYTASKRIKETAARFKGIGGYDSVVEPLRKELGRFPKSSEVRRGARYYYLMGLAEKKRSTQVLLALKQIAVRYPKSAYGKAARAALKDLQDPKAKVDARSYIGRGE